MSNVLLYPFRIDTDFRAGYAWSVELARRLKLRLSLFTTTVTASTEPVSDIYRALADAQGYYVKNFEILHLRLTPVKSEKNFLDGEFVKTFCDFTNQNPPHIIVMQSDLFSNEVMKGIIDSGKKVIVLSSKEITKSSNTKNSRAQLFITMLQSAALYNIPASFFKTISKDTSLFNSIAAFFRRG